MASVFTTNPSTVVVHIELSRVIGLVTFENNPQLNCISLLYGPAWKAKDVEWLITVHIF